MAFYQHQVQSQQVNKQKLKESCKIETRHLQDLQEEVQAVEKTLGELNMAAGRYQAKFEETLKRQIRAINVACNIFAVSGPNDQNF